MSQVGRLKHRDRELAAVSEVLSGIPDGRPGVVLIRGVRGIGKSALMRAAVNHRPMDAVVLRAQCHESERDFDLGMVRQLFDPVLQQTGDRLTPGLFAAEAHQAAAAAYDRPGGTDAASHDLMRALFQITRSLAAAKPVIVGIDDLTSADEWSVLWFSYLARRIEGLPVTLIATVDAEAGDELEHRLTGLPFLRMLQPSPLCPACGADYVADRLRAPLDAELATLCHSLSLGNPQVLTELATRLAAAGVPPGAPDMETVQRIGAETLSATTLDWLQARDPVAMELLKHLAVLEPGAGLATAAAIAGHGEFEADLAREALRRRGLIDSADRIRDDVIRTAVLSRLDAAHRVRIHERAAELLTRLGAPPAVIARHLMSLGSTRGGNQLRVLTAAAQAAAAAGDPDLASRYLRRALAAAEDPEQTRDLTGRLGRVEQHRDVAAFQQLAESAAAGAEGPATRAHALHPFLSPVLIADSSALSRTLANTARALAVGGATPLDLSVSFGAYALLTGHRAEYRRTLRSLLHARAEQPRGAEFLGALAAAAAADGRCPRAARRLALRSLGAAGPAPSDLRSLGAVLALSWSGDADHAAALVDTIIDTVTSHGHRGEQALALLVRSDLRYRRGDAPGAACDAARAADLARLVNAVGMFAIARAAQARARVRLGELDAARLLLAQPAPADLHPLGRAVWRQAMGMIAAADGDHAEALRHFLECGHHLAMNGVANQQCVPWRSHAAEQYLAQGEHEAARTIAKAPGDPGGQNGQAVRGVPGVPGGTAEADAHGPRSRAQLTTAEHRVVDLVRQGMSNAEVAERLFLSKRTVDTHLGRIYRKLAIGGRAELGPALDGGPTGPQASAEPSGGVL